MKIVAIPEKMQRFYGTGTMLHPDKEMVEAQMKEIPYGRVATIDSLCERLARDYQANVTCPMRSTNLVKKATAFYSNHDESIPFWRVIRKNHMLINSPFILQCAEYLVKEGFQVNQSSKGDFKVENLQDRLFAFL